MRLGSEHDPATDTQNGAKKGAGPDKPNKSDTQIGTKLEEVPEAQRVIPGWVKAGVDVAGFAPVAGNFASIGSAGLSVIELAGQALKGNKEGVKEAAVDLAVDGVSILGTRGGGLLAKGAVKLAQGGTKAGKVAKVIEKGGAMVAKGEAALGKVGLDREALKDAGKAALKNALLEQGKK